MVNSRGVSKTSVSSKKSVKKNSKETADPAKALSKDSMRRSSKQSARSSKEPAAIDNSDDLAYAGNLAQENIGNDFVPKPNRLSDGGRKVSKWSDSARALLREAMDKHGNGLRCVRKSNWPNVMTYFNTRAGDRDVSFTFAEHEMSLASSQVNRLNQQMKIVSIEARAAEKGEPAPPRRTALYNKVKRSRNVEKQNMESVREQASQHANAMIDYDDRLNLEVLRKRFTTNNRGNNYEGEDEQEGY